MPELTIAGSKVTADHQKRDAYLYARQSSLRQVADHGESTQRQYALKQRAVAAGWPTERIRIIDCDLGKSGSNATGRQGFQELVSDVALGKAGIVMGLEVSRLARNSADWHRLIKLCALTATLILDEDGIYDPAGFNDRLLLGLKGTMSEAELHILKARMRGGQLSKARRGRVAHAPARGPGVSTRRRHRPRPRRRGAGRDPPGLRHLQAHRQRHAHGSPLSGPGHPVPAPAAQGAEQGRLRWAPPRHSRILQLLHNPRYAGAFVYGRTRIRHRPDGGSAQLRVPRDQWQVVMPDMHPGYIDWQRFEANQQRLADNARAFGQHRRSGPVREGPALLQGRVLCGLCGARMGVRYATENGRTVPIYICEETLVRRGGPACQTVPGKVVDPAVADLLVELMTPMTMEVTLAVQRELEVSSPRPKPFAVSMSNACATMPKRHADAT